MSSGGTYSVPDATFLAIPGAQLSLDGSYTWSWSCGGPNDAVDRCELIVVDAGSNTTVHSRSVTDRDRTTLVWAATLVPSECGMQDLGVYTVAVRGYGNGTYGQYAKTGSFKVYADPTVTMSSPAAGAVLDSLPLSVAWTVDGSLTEQRVGIVHPNGAGVYLETVGNTVRSLEIGATDLHFETGIQYLVQVWARGISGSWSKAERTVSFQWTAPDTATLEVVPDPEALTASLTVSFGDSATHLETDHVAVMRGSHVLADAAQDGDVIVDPLPPLGDGYSYTVVALTSDGVPAYSEQEALVPAACWALNSPDGAIVLRFNPESDYSVTHGGSLYHLARGAVEDEGDGLPEWYGTYERDMGGSLQFDTVGHATADALVAASWRHPVMWLRDPFGHRWRAHVVPTVSRKRGSRVHISIAWDAVGWEE